MVGTTRGAGASIRRTNASSGSARRGRGCDRRPRMSFTTPSKSESTDGRARHVCGLASLVEDGSAGGSLAGALVGGTWLASALAWLADGGAVSATGADVTTDRRPPRRSPRKKPPAKTKASASRPSAQRPTRRHAGAFRRAARAAALILVDAFSRAAPSSRSVASLSAAAASPTLGGASGAASLSAASYVAACVASTVLSCLFESADLGRAACPRRWSCLACLPVQRSWAVSGSARGLLGVAEKDERILQPWTLRCRVVGCHFALMRARRVRNAKLCAFVSLSSCCWRGVRCAVLCARSCVRCTVCLLKACCRELLQLAEL